MRIDSPLCNFENCRYFFDHNCTAKKVIWERCEYRQHSKTGIDMRECFICKIKQEEVASVFNANFIRYIKGREICDNCMDIYRKIRILLGKEMF